MEKRLSSAQLLIQEATKRSIKVRSYEDIQPGFARLTQGKHQEYIFHSQSNLLGRVTARIFTDNKVLTAAVLREGGFPVPADIITNDIATATDFLREQGRIVVKPLNNTGGVGVTPNIQTPQELAAAFAFAAPENDDPAGRFVCQQHVEGRDYRVLVINQRHCFAMERIPAQVLGDGRHTIAALIEQANTTARPGYEVKITSQTAAILKSQGLTLESVPASNERIALALVANAHAGGTTRDVTEELSPEVRQFAIQVATYFACPLVGIDVMSPDIASDVGKIIELNASPDISIHYYPHHGQPQEIAPLIMDMLFPETV